MGLFFGALVINGVNNVFLLPGITHDVFLAGERRLQARPCNTHQVVIHGVQMRDDPSPASVSSRSFSRLTNAAGSSS